MIIPPHVKDKIHHDLRVVLGLFCFLAGWWLIMAGLSWLVGFAPMVVYFGTFGGELGVIHTLYAIAAILVGVRLLSYVWEWFVPALLWLARGAWWSARGVMFVVGFAKFLFHNRKRRKPPKSA